MTRGLAVVGVVGALLVSGCSARSVRIAELKDQPGRYDDRPVSITGRVTTSWGVGGFLPFHVYNVDDGTGEITVVSQTAGSVRRGTQVQVKGTVSELALVGGSSLGLHIREESRRIRN